MAENKELEQVIPNKYELKLKGKVREVKFGNLALAKIERKYGSVTNFKALQKDMESKPMDTLPWLLSICIKDKSDIGESVDDMLMALDDSDILISDISELLGEAMNSAMSRINGDGKKKAEKVTV
jgi:hypothetical protein